LSITKVGPNAAYFTLSKPSIDNIAIGVEDTFTVTPRTGINPGTYRANITVSSATYSIRETVVVNFTVDDPTYEISLDQTETYNFPGAYTGYGAQAAKTIAVNNTGNQATGLLNIALSGTNPGSFMVSETTISGIAAGRRSSFTVTPNEGLGAGTYTSTIRVSGSNGISATVSVSFTVELSTHSVSLDTTGTYDFPDAVAGYGAQAAKTVVVSNTGNRPTGELTITVTGGSFTVTPTRISNIAVEGSGSFRVAPLTGLDVGTYNANITVSGSNDISEDFNVSFEVIPADYAISLEPTGAYAFPGALAGYGAQAAKTVVVKNEGNKATGQLTVAASNNSFRVSPNRLSGIPLGEKRSFTVAPVAGLGEGTHTAAITVSGGNDISKSFEVSFTVTGARVSFNADGDSWAVTTATAQGGRVVLPANPTKSGYTFSGWYTAPNGAGRAFTAATTVTADTTVYARWLSADANLAALSVDPGSLVPAFNASTTAYTVTVPNETASIRIDATAKDFGKARVEQPPNPVPLRPGENVIEVRVTAEDEITNQIYRITVTRTPLSANADLAGLAVSEGELSPAFSPAVTAYTLLVPTTTTNVTVSAAAAAGGARLEQTPQNPVSLGQTPRDITIKVTAADGTATKTYAIRVSKTAEPTAVNVAIGRADERIDLTRDTAKDLSQGTLDTLVITAPEGSGYAWWVDGADASNNTNEITLSADDYSPGTHSVLLEYSREGIPYGCEVIFRVVR
jgi:uncharacterized repeat protein (TIGR02543 family)